MKFSIIVPHYDLSISDEKFRRGMNSLLGQTFKDFEVLVYHDGPISREVPMPKDPRFKLTATESRENNWGHSNRNRGISEAKGEYILHFNPDNVLYHNALSSIDNEIKKSYDYLLYEHRPPNSIIVFPILMIGMQTNGRLCYRVHKASKDTYMIFTGYPCVKNNIDAMQLVMKKSLWEDYGGWYDLSEESDGNMYPRFVRENGARFCSEVLGEHW